MSAPSLMMLPSATACACGHRFGLHAIGVPHGCTEDDCTCGAFVMTTPDPVLAATTADVRKRCDELEKALADLIAAFPVAFASESQVSAFADALRVLHG